MSNKSDAAISHSQCSIDERWTATTAVISCAGVIDQLTAPQLEHAIAVALTKSPEAIIVDLTRVKFLACHGMGVLIATDDLCASTARFAVVADGPATARPMRLVGLTDILPVHATLDAALADVGAP